MSNVAGFLNELLDLNIKFRLESGKLKMRAPQGVLDEGLRIKISDQKEELIDYLKSIQNKKVESSEITEIKPVERKENIPLSFGQQRLWFLFQLEPHSTAYNLLYTLQIKGTFHIDMFQKTLDHLLLRHEILRTTFTSIDGEPLQNVHDIDSFPLKVKDLTGLEKVSQEEALENEVKKVVEQPFNLSTFPLIRCTIAKLDHDTQAIILGMHHIISDRWSMGIFMNEALMLYQEKTQDRSQLLPPLPLQYADYAFWQRRRMAGTVLKNHQEFWKGKINHFPFTLDFPTDYSRPAIQRFEGKSFQFEVPSLLSEKIKKLAKQTACTLFMTLISAFSVLLYRYSSQEKFLIGAPIANRNRAELEGLIGFFVNTLVFPFEFTENLTFLNFLRTNRQSVLEIFEYQDFPFEKLVEEIQPERDLSRNPVFQVMFVLQSDSNKKEMDKNEIMFQPFSYESSSTQFDLTLNMEETSSGLFGQFDFNTSLFSSARISKLIEHFLNLLEDLVSNPSQNIVEFRFLSELEEKQILMEWSESVWVDSPNLCVHELFEKQVLNTPHLIAVNDSNSQWSYSQLNSRANQLAAHLTDSGISKGDYVGVCLERSNLLVCVILSILKAGGVYVPLEPNTPPDRMNSMVDSINIKLLVHADSPDHLEKLPVAIVGINQYEWDDENEYANLQTDITADDLCYLIFTSGTTGIPKGSGVYHKGFVNTLLWFKEDLGIDCSSQHLPIASISFDLSQKSFFAPLICGGQLNLLPSSYFDPPQITKAIQDHQVPWINCSPSAFYALIDESEKENFISLASLKHVVLGGEPISKKRLEPWFSSSNCSAQLVNSYGPTECSDVVLFYKLQDWQDMEDAIPIGKPIRNTKVYVLDQHLQPVPPMIQGELYIAGAGLGKGYIGDAQLTLEKFIPNPFDRLTGSKLYKTGDRVRFLNDGNIEFLGRVDHQFKLRGFRIEPQEIEAHLQEIPQIKESLVLLQNIEGGDYLVAYVIAAETTSILPSEIISSLKKKLPDYMIPSFFTALDKFPLNKNEKIDRSALPIPSLSEDTRRNEFVDPRNETELHLLNIWKKVLRLEKVSIYDNFFDLGGHSLIATQVTSLSHQQFQIKLTLKDLFESPTVAGLANIIERLKLEGAQIQFNPILRQEKSLIPLSYSQQRLWFIEQLVPNTSAYNIYSVIRIQGDFHLESFRFALNQLMIRHESLRTSIQLKSEEPKQIITDEIEFPLTVLDLSRLEKENPEENIFKLVNEEIQRPFELSIAPLIRSSVFQLSQNENILILTMHHIISDGWSMQIIVKELLAFYEAHQQNTPVSLPPLPIQYSDFTLWQRENLQGETLQAQIDFWKKTLQGFPERLNLPTDYPQPDIQTFEGAIQGFQLSEGLSQQVNDFCRKEGITLFMFFFSAFSILLHRYSFQDKFLIGTPIANRNRSEIEGIIGFFVNTLVLPVDLSGNPYCLEFLKNIRNISLEAFSHQDLPFERLVDEMQPNRDLRGNPLFQVMLVLQNGIKQEYSEMPDFQITPMESQHITTKFDLTLTVEEQDRSIECFFEYNTSLFSKEKIEFMVNHFQFLVEGIITKPENKIAEISFISSEENELLFLQGKQLCLTDADTIPIRHLFQNKINYWRNYSADLVQPMQFPNDLGLKYDETKESLILTEQVDFAIWKELQQKSQKLGVSPLICLLGSFAEIIGKWSKTSGFSLDLASSESQFFPPVSLNFDFSNPSSLIEKLKVLQVQLWNTLEQEYLFDDGSMIELQKGPYLSNSQLKFYIGIRESDLEQVKLSHSKDFPENYLLQFQIQEFEKGIELKWTFNSSSGRNLINDWFSIYKDLIHDLSQQTKSWNTPVLELLPIAQTEKWRTINSTEKPITNFLLQDLFQIKLSERGDKLAIISGGNQFTYNQVEHISLSIADELIKAGAKPNQLVAIVMEKGWEQVVGALGILRAGAAYLPIDASLPKERVANLIELGEVEIVLTVDEDSISAKVPEEVQCIKVAESRLALPKPSIPGSLQTKEDIAYVIFTSGSTGTPKGVIIDHIGAVNTVLDINEKFHITENDKVFALSALSFDLSVYDIFGIFATGGTVVIPQQDELKDPEAWFSSVQKNKVTVCNMVPAQMQMLVEQAEIENVKLDIKLVMMSGDWIPLHLPGRIQSVSEHAQVVSLGGATEASIWSIFYPIKEVASTWKSIPYGKPLTNQTFHVLKPDFSMCPHGIVGDLYIGGIGLAKGYWKDEKKTRQNFVLHPDTGDRLYKTGDLGKYMPDGNIEFLGREDFQVKIHGYRVELGEIESCLIHHESIQDAIVTVTEDGVLSKKLVAYTVSNRQSQTDSFQLSEYLKEKLPDYMVPSNIISLDSFPLNNLGKVDRAALQKFQFSAEKNYVPPETETEILITNVLTRILNVSKIGINKNFFEAGANSLLFVHIQRELKKSYQDIKLTDLFEFPTIKKLADQLNLLEQENNDLIDDSETRASMRRGARRQRA